MPNNRQMVLRRGGVAAAAYGAANALSRIDYGQLSEFVARQVNQYTRKPPPQPPKPRGRKKQPGNNNNNKRDGNITKIDVPSAFGTTSNNLVRSVTLKSTADSVVLRGTTILGSVMVGSNSSGYLPNVALYGSSNPVTFEDRMQVIATTYDKYVYNWVKLRYIPQCPTSTAGLVILAIDRDYTDAPQTSSLATAQSYEAACMGSAFSAHSCMMKRDTHEKRTYFVSFGNDVNIRDSEQFKFYCFTSGAPNGLSLGQLVLDYEIQLISPIYSPPELSSSLTSLGISTAFAQVPIFGATTALCKLPFLPNPTLGVGQVFEMIFQCENVNTVAGLTLGVGGPAWTVNSTLGSLTLYAVGVVTATATGYNVYLDYNTAMRSGVCLYNPGLTTGFLLAAAAVSFRPLTYISP